MRSWSGTRVSPEASTKKRPQLITLRAFVKGSALTSNYLTTCGGVPPWRLRPKVHVLVGCLDQVHVGAQL